MEIGKDKWNGKQSITKVDGKEKKNEQDWKLGKTKITGGISSQKLMERKKIGRKTLKVGENKNNERKTITEVSEREDNKEETLEEKIKLIQDPLFLQNNKRCY